MKTLAIFTKDSIQCIYGSRTSLQCECTVSAFVCTFNACLPSFLGKREPVSSIHAPHTRCRNHHLTRFSESRTHSRLSSGGFLASSEAHSLTSRHCMFAHYIKHFLGLHAFIMIMPSATV